MSTARAALSEDERRARSAAASARLLALPELAALGGRTVAGYVAIKGELDPTPALAAAAAQGAAVVLPRIADGDAPALRFHRAEAGAPLTPGRFGLLEPADTAPEVALEELEVVVVPGLAFDAEGRRLGFGGGYYDRAFAGGRVARRPALIGLAYDFQVVARCPAGALDVPVDVIVTDIRVLRPAGEAR